jgi:hypothetical protein
LAAAVIVFLPAAGCSKVITFFIHFSSLRLAIHFLQKNNKNIKNNYNILEIYTMMTVFRDGVKKKVFTNTKHDQGSTVSLFLSFEKEIL